MPSNPKILKENMLKVALTILIKEGYEAVNIKSIAKKIGCSTQPISWQFGNMDGLRQQLKEYAVNYANGKMQPTSNDAFEAFTEVGEGYIEIAFNETNLFKYLYIDGFSKYNVGSVDMLASATNNAELVNALMDKFQISKENAMHYLTNSIIYSHGLLALKVSDVLNINIDEARKMINQAGFAFLKQCGVTVENKKLDNRLEK